MFDLASVFDNVVESVSGSLDDLGDALDFGFGDDEFFDADDAAHATPEVDLTELERANETNLNFPNVLTSTPALIVGGLLISFVALKAFKVI